MTDFRARYISAFRQCPMAAYDEWHEYNVGEMRRYLSLSPLERAQVYGSCPQVAEMQREAAV